MKRIHRHAVIGAAVGEKEAVEFLEFFIGEGVVGVHVVKLVVNEKLSLPLVPENKPLICMLYFSCNR